MKRYLDCSASDLADIGKADLLYAIRASERAHLGQRNHRGHSAAAQ